jgi:hypothetical protein
VSDLWIGGSDLKNCRRDLRIGETCLQIAEGARANGRGV